MDIVSSPETSRMQCQLDAIEIEQVASVVQLGQLSDQEVSQRNIDAAASRAVTTRLLDSLTEAESTSLSREYLVLLRV